MRRLPPAPYSRLISRFLGAVFCLAIATAPARAQVIVGPNVNMGGGPATFDLATRQIVGDPFLQRQNEPSLAVSSRNPCHLLAGANDYRAVDVEDAAGEVGDAWLGVFKSFDCGATWTSTLMPGHKLDTSAQGLASPIKGLAAAADATVRAGTNGLFYYSGIAFNRGDSAEGKVFVARFLDNNNKDGGDPIQYLGAAQIDRGTSGQFLDKPWIIADIPRGGSTCTVNNRSVPAGPVYLVYTSFVGGDNNVRSKILFSKSNDCGVTWSTPSKLSEGVAKNQGTTIAVDPGTGDIHLAWREFSSPGDTSSRNAIIVARSTNGGQSFTKAAAITPNGYQFQPFDQASSPLTFRTNAYPAIAVVPAEADGRAAGQPGRVYVAWSARGFGNERPSDARIVISSSVGGTNWTDPRPTDTYPGAGHQIMPTLSFAGGKMALAYYDLRDDAAGGFEDLVMEYGQNAFDQCMLSPGPSGPLGFAAVLMCVIENPSLSRRHTLDMRAAIVDAGPCLAGGTCVWSGSSLLGSNQVSRYAEGRGTPNGARQQLQYNRPNLPIFSKGRFPFIGDYIDIAGQSFVAKADGGWSWNTGKTANRPAPVFHVAWADNRNVGTPRHAAGISPDWSRFTPPMLGPNSVVCIPGLVGTRNQDVYTAQLRPGLVVSSPQNSKRITGLQRSFVVVAHNTTDSERHYRLRAMPTGGAIASFNQFSGFGTGTSLTEIFVTIPRKSSVSRTLFVALANPPVNPADAPDVLVPVQVDEVDGSTPTGTFDQVFLNPDFENPDFENPDFENAELHNPDFENPDFENPDFENPDFENFTLSASSSIRNPDFENPDFENPDFENPDFENPDFENPDFENPDFENPDFENPDFENPDFENPDFENPDFENGSFQVSDTTWPVRNNGNTSSAYKTNVFVQDPPAGVQFQLAIRKLFTGPAAMCTADGSAPLYAQSVPLVNIVGPNVQTDPFDRNFNDPSRNNASFLLAPGERGVITLRAYCADGAANCTRELMASLRGKVALGVVAQGANCFAEDNGLGDAVGGLNRCVVDNGPPKDIYDPIPPMISVLNPTITTPETIVQAIDVDNTGFEAVAFSLSATDNVAVASVSCLAGTTTVSPTGVSGDAYQFTGTFPVGATAVTCTALDVRGTPAPNSASVGFVVNVRDVTPPSFDVSADPGSPFLPSNPAEATSAAGAQVFYSSPAATDSNGGLVTVTCGSGSLVSGSTFPIGTTDINCVATDDSGVSTAPTNLFDITVADRAAPSITIDGAPTAAVEGNVLGGAAVTFTASASDAVSGTLLASCSVASGSVFAVGITTVTCTATDAASNTGSSSFAVTVVDTIAPVVTLNGAAAITIEAGSTYADPGATAMDVVAGARTVAVSGSVNLLSVGIYTLTYVASDPSGNTASAVRTVTVADRTAPGFGSLANVTAEATSAAGATVTYTSPSATDIADASLTISCVKASGSAFALGISTVNCTATDDSGNVGNGSFTVTVLDRLAPAFGAVVNVIAEATSPAGAAVTYTAPSATDAVGATVSCLPAAGSTFALGTSLVRCTATDAALNSAATTLTVTVRDTVAPALTVPANITTTATSAAGAVVNYTAPSATDIVDTSVTLACPSSPTAGKTSGSTFPIGTTTVNCTATDDYSNVTSKSFTVTVNNPPLPVVTATANPSTLLWSPNKTMTPVTVSGVITTSILQSASYRVVDEYGKVQPAGTITVGTGGSYSFVVRLEAFRNGTDTNGRVYTITVTATDTINRTATAQAIVLVPHSQQ